MMKLIMFLSFTSYLFFSNSNVKPKDCIVVPNKGMNNIVIGKSTLKDVQKEFGAKKVKKKWHKAIEVEVFGKYEYYLEYDSIATFSTLTKERNKKIVYKIILDSNSQCKTLGGNGIGSSYRDITEELGEPTSFYYFTDNGKNKTNLSYNKVDIIMEGKDTLTNKVKKIIIW